MYWFCHTLTWILHECTCVPHPEPPSHLPPYPNPLGHPSAPAPSTLYHASNLDWQFISHILYMFQCHSPILSHPRPLPESKRLFYTSVSLLLSCIQGYHYLQICISGILNATMRSALVKSRRISSAAALNFCFSYSSREKPLTTRMARTFSSTD